MQGRIYPAALLCQPRTMSKWTVDLGAMIATHIDGWQFVLWPDNKKHGAYVGVCMRRPNIVTKEYGTDLSRFAREASDAYVAAISAKNKKAFLAPARQHG